MSTPQSDSPGWSPTTKLVVALSVVAIVAAMFIRFRFIIGPVIMAFVLAYLLTPLVGRLSRLLHVPWKGSVAIVFVVLLLLLLSSITLLGFGAVQQVQSLYKLVQGFITDLPNLVANLSTQKYLIGSFELDFSQYNLNDLLNQLLPNVQAIVGRIGTLVTSLASSTLGTLGWILFILAVAYFLLSQVNAMTDALLPFELPGYSNDMRRLGVELRKIWNSFLRGQLLVIFLVIVTYSVLLAILGVRYSLALALLTGAARLVPYVGPFVNWVTIFLVAIFQARNYFGMEQLDYAIMIVVICFIIDQIFDNIVSPRMLGDTLGVHPAALLVMAIVAANLFGIVGLVLAAPVLATITLLGRYIFRKMSDLEPFPEREEKARPEPWILNRSRLLWRFLRRKISR